MYALPVIKWWKDDFVITAFAERMNFMRGLFNRFANFMQGRYGTDKLNNALWVLLLILWFVNIFVWNRVARYIIDGIMLLVIVLICFRMFSRNIVARSAENRKFFRFTMR